ncbi:hypothetical protein KBB96_03290 [Luteolibacter ambystomatis]|uniref:Alpha 1,4-glycosyltransferase domain-containing protein n=1 Tax=Luteolibacter ambystomatis TaxID=2824561 RepID=A0A975J0U8_9BACT|nr:glycosyltransferase [Luteolibacter ambystomatis]QUE51919.1 hypothetical protein KBB96_03290 [Luteolibacter ambystomatis]
MQTPHPSPTLPVISSLWIGDELPALGELTIRSFMDHGHAFDLYTYGPVKGVPEGASVLDGSSIIPRSSLFRHNTGSFAPFADWFRYELLYRKGGVWTDLDVACLKPFQPEAMPWFCRQEGGIISVGLLAFEPGHEVLRQLVEFCEKPGRRRAWQPASPHYSNDEEEKARLRINAPFASNGPFAFTEVIKHHELAETAAPHHLVYPFAYPRWLGSFNGKFRLEDDMFRDSIAIHLYGEMLRRSPNAVKQCPPGNLVDTLMLKHRCLSPLFSGHEPVTDN